MSKSQADPHSQPGQQKDWYMQESIDRLTSTINRWDAVSESMEVPENQDCLFCSRLPQNRRATKIGLRSHMFQCSVRKTLLNGCYKNSQNLNLPAIQGNFKTAYNNAFQFEMRIKIPILSAIEKIEKSCLMHTKDKLQKEHHSDQNLGNVEHLKNVVRSISLVLKGLLPNFIQHTLDLSKLESLEMQDVVKGLCACMFAHFLSCNVEKSLGFSLLATVFDSLESQCNTVATDLWMKSFINLDCAIGDKTSLIKPSTSPNFTCGNEWTSILCSSIYKGMQESSDEKLTEDGALQISDSQIQTLAKVRFVRQHEDYNFKIMSGTQNLSSHDSSKANVKSSDCQNSDKDLMPLYAEDDIQYPALRKPQGPTMFTLNQSYISKQTKNKARVRQFNQAADVKCSSPIPKKTSLKAHHDIYNSNERSYRAKRKIPGGNQIGIQKHAGTVGNHAAPSVAKKRKINESSLSDRYDGQLQTKSDEPNKDSGAKEGAQNMPWADGQPRSDESLNVCIELKKKASPKQKYRYVCKKKQWDEFSDLHLQQLVERFGNDWKSVSRELPGYTEGQCRQRWHEIKLPTAKMYFDNGPGNWSELEDWKVATLKHSYGKKWTDIARQMPGRTDLMVKNRFYSCLRKIKRNTVYRNAQLMNKDVKYVASTYLEKFLVEQIRSKIMPLP